MAGWVDDLGDAVRQTIRAYHGSPYDFDKVDMSMVTKGEGPLMEGFGFYSTGDQNTANWYRHRTAATRRKLLARELSAARAAGNQDAIDSARALASRLQGVQPHGRTYELEILHPESALLQYNTPLSKQSDTVRSALETAFPRDLAENPDLTGGQFYQWVLSGGSVLDRAPVPAQRRASEMLFNAGIPGHAYEHGGKNYVMYPGAEDQIRILRKY